MIAIPKKEKEIMQNLLDRGHQAYIIGGFVRDSLLGITPHDIDIFTDATGEQMLVIFPQGKIIGGEERQAKILTVIVDGVEISQFRSNGSRTQTGNDLYKHLSTCDYTINAYALDINGIVYNYSTFDNDLDKKMLRFVGNPEDRVKEDPLRIFRGIRLMGKYCSQYADTSMFSNFKEYVETLPRERIRDELMKIIQSKSSFEELDFWGMLSWMLPEWEDCRGLHGGKHHNESVNVHMMTALNKSRELTNNPLLMLAVFLHDIGKPESTHRFVGDGEIAQVSDEDTTFYNHHTLGEEIVRQWMPTMRFSQDDINYVATIVRHHMMGKTGDISAKTFNKICQDLKNNGVAPEDMLVCTFCDNQANKKNPKLSFNEFLKNNGFLQRYYETLYTQKGFDSNCLEITGHDIMKFGYTGKEIGKVKQDLFDLVSCGVIINRRDKLLERIKGE